MRDGEKHVLSPGEKVHDEEDLSSRFRPWAARWTVPGSGRWGCSSRPGPYHSGRQQDCPSESF